MAALIPDMPYKADWLGLPVMVVADGGASFLIVAYDFDRRWKNVLAAIEDINESNRANGISEVIRVSKD